MKRRMVFHRGKILLKNIRYILLGLSMLLFIIGCASSPVKEVSTTEEKEKNKEETNSSSLLSNDLLKSLLEGYKKKEGNDKIPFFLIDPGYHLGGITDMVYCALTREIITSGKDNTLRFWDFDSGQEEKKILLHNNNESYSREYFLALSQDQKYIAVGCNTVSEEKGNIRIFNSETGVEAFKSHSLELDIISLSFSQDNTLLIANAKDNTIKYLKFSEEYRIPRTLQLGLTSLSAAAFINNENDIFIIAVGTEEGMKIFSLNTNEMIYSVNPVSPILSLAVHQDYIAAGLANQTIVVMDHQLAQVAIIEQNYNPEIFTFSPDNKYLLSVNPPDNHVLLFDMEEDFTPGIIETDFTHRPVRGRFIDTTTILFKEETTHQLYSMDMTTGEMTQRGTSLKNAFTQAIITDNALVLKGEADAAPMELSLGDFTYKTSDREVNARRLSLTAGEYSIIRDDADEKTGKRGSIEVKKGETSSSMSIQWESVGLFGFLGEEYVIIEYPGGMVKVYNTMLEYLCTLKGISGPLQDLTFSSHFIAILDKNNIVNLWRIQDIPGAKGNIFPHLFFYTDKDQRWILFARNGYYTCGNKGDRWLWLSKEDDDKESSRIFPVTLFSSLYKREDFLLSLVSGLSYKIAEEAVKQSQPLKQVNRIFPEEEYYLSGIAGQWTVMDILEQKNTASLTYMYEDMTIFAMILEEPTENTFLFSGVSDYMDNVVITNYKKTFVPFKILAKEAYDKNGKSGKFLVFNGKFNGIEIRYYVWLYHQHNHIYQIICWEMNQNEEYNDVPGEIEDFLDSFNTFTPGVPERNIDKNLLTYNGPGYKVDYKAAGFEPWTNIQDYYYLAESGGYEDSGIAFYITPLYTGTTNPSTESLTWAYLTALGIEYSNADLKDFQRIKTNDLSGVKFFYTGDIDYYIQIVKSDYYAYFIMNMVKDKNNINPDVLQQLYDSISFAREYGKEREEQLLSGDTKSSVTANSADIMNEIGLYYYNNNQFSKALSCFQTAFETDTTNATYLENYLYLCANLNKFEEGLRYIETHINLFPNNFTLISYLAYFQKQTGLKEEALSTYVSIFSQGYREDYDFVDYVTLLWEMGEQEKALSEIAVYQREKVSIYVARTEADFYDQLGEYDKGIALLTDIYTTMMFDQDLVLELCNILNDAGRFQEAIALCEEVIGEDHASAEIYYFMGINQMELNWYKEAKLSLEKAHDLNPGDAAIQEYLDYVSGLLGEKDNTSVKVEIAAVPVPEEYFLITNPSTADSFSGSDSYYHHRITAISYEKEKEMRVTMYYKITVLSYAGISYFSNFNIPFDPGAEGLFVNELHVFNEKGELVATGDVANYYIIDDTTSGMATNNKMLNIPISGLQPGYTFSIIITKKLYTSDSEPVYYYDYLARSFPIINNYFIVSGDIDEIVYSTRNMAKPEHEEGHLIWQVQKAYENVFEPYQEAADNYIPIIYIGSAHKTWKEEALMYLDEIKERLTPSPEVNSLARELTNEVSQPDETIRALLTYVQKNYIYQAIEFGRRAWIPNSGETIIHNKYGDCKDQSLLLYLLLKAVNIPSYLVLCNSRMMIAPEVPDLDQYNHMIVYIPDYENGLFCDPTDKYYDISKLYPHNLRGMSCLILDNENPRIATIPEIQGEFSSIESRRIITIGKSGSIRVQEELHFKKYLASFFRANLSQEDASQRQNSIQSFMSSSMPGIKLNSLDVNHLHDTSQDLVLNLEYTADNVFKEIEGRLIGELPAVWERLYIYLQHIRERKSPIRVYIPFTFKSEIHLIVPGEYTFLQERDPKKNENLFTTWSVSRDYMQDEFVVTFNFTLYGGSYEIDSYESFEHALNGAVEELEQAIVLVQ